MFGKILDFICTRCRSSNTVSAELRLVQIKSLILQYRSNFGEVDVAPAKNDKINKVEKWQKLIAGLNPNHMHIFKPWKKDVQSCIKIGMKLYNELHLQDNHCLYTFIESEVRKWQSSQSGKSDKN